VVLPEPGSDAEKLLVQQLTAEFLTPQTREQVIAYRGDRRMVQYFEPVPLEPAKTPLPCFRQGGVYLIIGGLGGVGLIMAEYLFKTVNAKLILTSRYGLPPKDQCQEADEKTVNRIHKVQALKNLGADVMVVVVDVSDEKKMQETVEKARARFGPINGVIHCGYVPDGTVIDQRTKEMNEAVFAPKVRGTLILDRIFETLEPLDFFVICSSLAAIFGPPGQVGYAAAGAFQDAFAYYRRAHTPLSTYNISINWCGWAGTQALLESVTELASRLGIDPESQLKDTMLPEEGLDAFARIMAANTPQVLVSPQELSLLLTHLNSAATAMEFQENLAEEEISKSKIVLKRPNLKTVYVAPRSETEETIAHIWQDFFGFETVGVRDDFFELGGDSLKAMTVSAKIHRELNIKIPIATFFSTPTIEELTQYIEEKGQKETHLVIPKAKEKEYYPLSAMQERLFFLQQKDPESTDYNITLPFLLEGPVDKEKLETTFKQLFKRHETYRTSLHLVDNRPMQKIHPAVDFQIEYHDSTPEEAEELILNLKAPFNLSQAPIFRAMFIHLEKEKNLLVLDTHHAALDGTSFGIFQKEFMDLYGDRDLPPLKTGYKDYCQWQYERFRGGELEKMETYWLEQFKDPVPALNLPTDFPRPKLPGYEGHSMWYNIDKTKTRQLRELAQKTGTTTFMLFMAVYSILLHKYSSREDIVVGIRIACRPHTDLEKIIGRFSNELGFRSHPTPGITFKEFLEEIKRTALGLFKHQEYPFERLPERLNYPWNTERSSLFDTMVVYNNIKAETPDVIIEGLKLLPYGIRKVNILYDIFLQATEIGDIINLFIQYSTSLFKQETVERMIRDFMHILECIIENPDILLSQIAQTQTTDDG